MKTVMIALLLAAPAAHAVNWSQVTSGDGAMASVDMDTIKRVGPKKVSATVYWQFDEPTPISEGSIRTFSSSKELTLFNCSTGGNRAIGRLMFSDKNSESAPLLNAGRKDDDAGYSVPPPGTMAEEVTKFVCAWKPKKSR